MMNMVKAPKAPSFVSVAKVQTQDRGAALMQLSPVTLQQ